MFRPLIALITGATLAWPALAAELLMVEQPGCFWCTRWDNEIADIYPKTTEGQAAPLRRIQIRSGGMGELEFDRPVSFTPTFVLIEDGRELSRIEGYPGEDFFWGLLGVMLENADAQAAENGGS